MAAPPTDSFTSFQTNITEAKAQNPQTNGSTLSRGPSPNRGASVPDNEAIGPESTTQKAWLSEMGIDKSKHIKLTKLSHMRYQHENLDEITIFLRDFGLNVIKKTDTERWYGGYGPDQYVYYARQGPKKFLGGTFEVESHQELEKVVSTFPDCLLTKGIEPLSDAPGGGHLVTITDPNNFPVNFIHGQTPSTDIMNPHTGQLVANTETSKPRQRQFQRFTPGPAAIHKLGHFGLVTDDFPTLSSWYTQHFNIVPSDILYIDLPDSQGRKEVAMFAHLDRGQDHVDHHSIFLATLTPDSSIPHPHVHHCSFEVHDFDTQALGHQWLAEKGYTSVWGVGRHILGSQIFDYW